MLAMARGKTLVYSYMRLSLESSRCGKAAWTGLGLGDQATNCLAKICLQTSRACALGLREDSVL